MARRITTAPVSANQAFARALAIPPSDARLTGLLEMIADVEADMDNRPLVGGPKLTRAECPIQCSSCYLGCAMLPGILAALERELAHLGGVPTRRLRRDGIGEA